MDIFKFEFEGMDELVESLKKVEKSAPDLIYNNLRLAGRHFVKDVKANTERLTKKHTGNLLGGYVSEMKADFNGVRCEVSGGYKKASHYHLIENGHEGYAHGKHFGFVEGKKMMEKTVDEWESGSKILKYAERAVNQATKKGFI